MEQKEVQEEKPEAQEKNIFEDLVGDLINLERGLPATFITMIKSPGTVINSYFADEKKFVNPFKYTIFILAITTLITTFFVDYEVVMQQAAEASSSSSAEELDANLKQFEEETGINITGFLTGMKDVSVALMTKFSQVFYIIVLAPLFALSSRLFFKKRRPLFKHHYVMALYSVATFAVFSLLIIPLMLLPNSVWIHTAVSSGLIMICMMYAQIRYMDLKGFDDYAMSFLSFLVGYILYFAGTLFIQIVGGLILAIVRG